MTEYVPYIVYAVTQGNSDGSIVSGDLIYFDLADNLICGCGFMTKDELDASILDFKAEPDANHFVYLNRGHEFMADIQSCREMINQQLNASTIKED